jgi:hypothetical protein
MQLTLMLAAHPFDCSIPEKPTCAQPTCRKINGNVVDLGVVVPASGYCHVADELSLIPRDEEHSIIAAYVGTIAFWIEGVRFSTWVIGGVAELIEWMISAPSASNAASVPPERERRL